jgi:DNA-binding LytR/AlgR family response regulator
MRATALTFSAAAVPACAALIKRHRSTIVNLKAVAAVTRDEAGRGGSRTGRKRSP